MDREWRITPEKFLNRKELTALLARADELRVMGEAKGRSQLIRDWMIIETFIFTGLRRKEVSDLRCVDFRIFGGNCHLLVRHGKGGKPRHVHLPKGYAKDVRWYLKWKAGRGEIQDSDAYFLRTERSGKYFPSGIYKRWKKYCPNHRLPAARHTHATALYEAPKSLRLVQKQLGHASIGTTQVYADVTAEQSIAGMTAMERMMHSPAGRPRMAVESVEPEEAVAVPA